MASSIYNASAIHQKYNNLESFPSEKSRLKCRNLLLLSGIFAFTVGLTLGAILTILCSAKAGAKTMEQILNNDSLTPMMAMPHQPFPTVSFLQQESQPDDGLISDGIYWGEIVERSLPRGYRKADTLAWKELSAGGSGLRLEKGCGRMQNRLIVFDDGSKGCVRYRQNMDQIQGELFSFYLGQLLNLANLAPSAVSIIDMQVPMWSGLRSEIVKAQWSANKPVVLTEYIEELAPASIPALFRPHDRHLNRYDVLNATMASPGYVELAQWSDLIVFDYLTANLDRVVNNLYNFQWNSNIMEAPAHNLARKGDLLLFLDNESGLLHGYRLLKKYEIYHALLLENLCVFRRGTVDALRELRRRGNVGELLRDMFEAGNSAKVRDLLPTLPEKSVKILKERIEKVHTQVLKCQAKYGTKRT